MKPWPGSNNCAGNIDQAVKTLERGLELSADKIRLRLTLANVLAGGGETGKLLLQIEELKKIGYNSVLVQFLTAQYHINSHEFNEARQLLVPLESERQFARGFQGTHQRYVGPMLWPIGRAGDAARSLPPGL